MIDPRYSVTGSGLNLSEKQKELISLADSVGPAFAKRAAKYDRDATFPFENYADLKKAGLASVDPNKAPEAAPSEDGDSDDEP